MKTSIVFRIREGFEKQIRILSPLLENDAGRYHEVVSHVMNRYLEHLVWEFDQIQGTFHIYSGKIPESFDSLWKFDEPPHHGDFWLKEGFLQYLVEERETPYGHHVIKVLSVFNSIEDIENIFQRSCPVRRVQHGQAVYTQHAMYKELAQIMAEDWKNLCERTGLDYRVMIQRNEDGNGK